MASISIFREHSLFACATTFRIFLDGNKIGNINNNSHFEANISSGNHTLEFKDPMWGVKFAAPLNFDIHEDESINMKLTPPGTGRTLLATSIPFGYAKSFKIEITNRAKN
ncbi:MAG: hypothetical protein J6A23_04055 [Thermoguttaceae bacterium]|nr:hypothetical protein [Thermoguttaceae bacterium]